MNLLHAGKSLSCIAATSTIGAVAVIPKVRSTLASLEKEIDPLEGVTFSNLVDVSSTTSTSSQEQINSALQKIAKWLKDNGGCKIKLVISTEGNEFYEVSEDKYSEEDISKSIFQPQSGMGGKSKFQRLADDLNEENDRKGNKEKYKNYKDEFKKRCGNKKGQFINLRWIGKVSEDKKDENKTYSENLKELMNLWVDEKVSRS